MYVLNVLHLGCLLHCTLPGGKIPVVFLDHREVPHDPNLTINVIMNILQMNKEILGKTLFIQLDNCARENKNRFLLWAAQEKYQASEVSTLADIADVVHTCQRDEWTYSDFSGMSLAQASTVTIVLGRIRINTSCGNWPGGACMVWMRMCPWTSWWQDTQSSQ